MAGKIAFVLAAGDDAPMIVNRLDYKLAPGGGAAGVGIMLLEEGSHERGEIELLARLLGRRCASAGAGLVVIDVGANIGTHTIAWARALGAAGEVIAIEPQERIFYALAGNIALNNCFNARALWAAAGERSGQVHVPRLDHRQPANFGGLSLRRSVAQDPGQAVDFSPAATARVPMLALDDLKLPRCDLIKIDVEGMEPHVLAGAAATLERCRPIVFAEHATCGLPAIRFSLPGYRLAGAGMSVLAMHRADPLWEHIESLQAAP